MMGKADRLGALQVRVPGNDRVDVLLGLVRDDRKQRTQLFDQLARLVAQIHPHVECDLVVSAARRVQPLPDVADALGQHLLDEHMDIFRIFVDGKLAAVKVVQDPLQRFDHRIGVFLRYDRTGREHGGVRHGTRDILPVHAAVHRDGGIEIIRNLIGRRARCGPPTFSAYVTFLRY